MGETPEEALEKALRAEYETLKKEIDTSVNMRPLAFGRAVKAQITALPIDTPDLASKKKVFLTLLEIENLEKLQKGSQSEFALSRAEFNGGYDDSPAKNQLENLKNKLNTQLQEAASTGVDTTPVAPPTPASTISQDPAASTWKNDSGTVAIHGTLKELKEFRNANGTMVTPGSQPTQPDDPYDDATIVGKPRPAPSPGPNPSPKSLITPAENETESQKIIREEWEKAYEAQKNEVWATLDKAGPVVFSDPDFQLAFKKNIRIAKSNINKMLFNMEGVKPTKWAAQTKKGVNEILYSSYNRQMQEMVAKEADTRDDATIIGRPRESRPSVTADSFTPPAPAPVTPATAAAKTASSTEPLRLPPNPEDLRTSSGGGNLTMAAKEHLNRPSILPNGSKDPLQLETDLEAKTANMKQNPAFQAKVTAKTIEKRIGELATLDPNSTLRTGQESLPSIARDLINLLNGDTHKEIAGPDAAAARLKGLVKVDAPTAIIVFEAALDMVKDEESDVARALRTAIGNAKEPQLDAPVAGAVTAPAAMDEPSASAGTAPVTPGEPEPTTSIPAVPTPPPAGAIPTKPKVVSLKTPDPSKKKKQKEGSTTLADILYKVKNATNFIKKLKNTVSPEGTAANRSNPQEAETSLPSHAGSTPLPGNQDRKGERHSGYLC